MRKEKVNQTFKNGELILAIIEELRNLFFNEERLNSYPKIKENHYKNFKANIPLGLEADNKRGRPCVDHRKKDQDKQELLKKYIIISLGSIHHDTNVKRKKVKEITSIVNFVNSYIKLCDLKDVEYKPLNFDIISLLNKYETLKEEIFRQTKTNDEAIDEMAKDNLLSLYYQSDDFRLKFRNYKLPFNNPTKNMKERTALDYYLELVNSFLLIHNGNGDGLPSKNKKFIKDFVSNCDPFIYFYLSSYNIRDYFLKNFDDVLNNEDQETLREAIIEFYTDAISKKEMNPIYHEFDKLTSWDEFDHYIQENPQHSKKGLLTFLLILMSTEKENDNLTGLKKELNFLVSIAHQQNGDIYLSRHIKFMNRESTQMLNGISHFYSLLKNIRNTVKGDELKEYRVISKMIESDLGRYIQHSDHLILECQDPSHKQNEKFNLSLFSSCEKLLKNLLQNKKITCYSIPKKFISPFYIKILSKTLASQISNYDTLPATLNHNWEEVCFQFVHSIFTSSRLSRTSFKNIPFPNRHKAQKEFSQIVAIEIKNLKRRMKEAKGEKITKKAA